MSELDDLVRGVRSLEAPPTERAADERAIRHAMLAGRTRHAKRSRTRSVAAALGGLALAAAVLLAVQLVRTDDRYELSLPTGDRLVARSDVRFEVEAQTPRLRRVRLIEGAMLFDVAPLADGASFEVVTASETIVVRGTVFVVEVTPHGTSVRVFGGRVEVRSGDGIHVLGAGQGDHTEWATARTAALEIEAAAVAGHRHAEPARRAATEPVVAPAIAPREVAVDRDLPLAPVGPAVHERSRRAVETAVTAPAVDALASARSALRAGDAEGALSIVRAVDARTRDADPAYGMLEADALRALGQYGDAADAYESLLARGDPSTRATAGYLAAEIRQRRLHDPSRARVILYTSEALAPEAGLRERALALDAEIADALHDASGLRASAEAYLAEFPDGPRAAWMHEHAP